MLARLTFALALAPERGLQTLRTLASSSASGDARPLLAAAGLAAWPVLAGAVSAAIPASRSVGSIVTTVLAAVLAYLGGAVAAIAVLEPSRQASPSARAWLGGVASAAVSLAGLLGAFGPFGLRLFAVGIGAIWAYVCVFRGARALLAPGTSACTRTALVGALVSSGPALLRLALPV